ncbi:MAG: cobalt transporter CbiM [Clostridia bacterium]|nr:cobalt transporter CbiM [Clostridia bacterium]
MHIPDGYLSLQTSVPALAAMTPVWAVALNKVKKAVNLRQIPLLALCSAFSFVIMMFNIPLGASSVHAVGAVLIAIIMGPWAACIAVSVALIIQAFLFGDGGILAIGANCFNMAFAMPFTGYAIYKLVSGESKMLSRRSSIGIFLGSFTGMNIAALLTAIEFGIQPLLFKAADGTPLYGFYPLSVSVPAIMFEHLLIAGPIEGIVTLSAVAYLVKFNPQIFLKSLNTSTDTAKSVLSEYRNFIIGLTVLIFAAPLGLIATGTAWGEWGTEEIQEMLGYIPQGFAKLSNTWSAMLPDYSVPGLDKSFFQSSTGYILSGIIGVAMIFTVMFISSKLITKKEN